MGILVAFILLTLAGIVNSLYKLVSACFVVSLILFITLLTGGFAWILWGVIGCVVAVGTEILLVTYQNRNSDENKF